MRGLSYEELAAAYELRHGFDTPTPWKRIASGYGTEWGPLVSAIRRLERNGLNRDADGNKPMNRKTRISTDMLEQVHKFRMARNRWDDIAFALGLPIRAVQVNYYRWRKARKI